MNASQYFNFNDKILRTGKAIITADNRSFRYGDGFFETMKMVNGKIALGNYHFERLFSALDILKFKKPPYFTTEHVETLARTLAIKNGHEKLARVRLTIFRGDGGLYDAADQFPNYIIQTWKLDPGIFKLNENGLATDIYTEAKKSCDSFSHIKSNNYLPYVMAAGWAKEKKLNDAFLLNNFNRLADATIANVFIVKDGKVKTPSLSEGCVSGVMRRHLLACMRKENIPVEETQIETEEIFEANEIFLTNAVNGIRWVKQCGKSNYNLQLAKYLFEKFTGN